MITDRRTLLLGAAAAVVVPAVVRAAEGDRIVLPRQAIHSDVIGPAAEIAMIRVYEPPQGATHTVSDWSSLAEALGRASAGDVILARAGDYGDSRRLRVQNNAAARVRLVSEAPGAARFTGRINIEGSGLSLEGWQLEKVELRGTSEIDFKHCRMTEFRLWGAANTLFEDFVCDGNFVTSNKIFDSRGNGEGTPTSGVTMRRGIVCRGGGAGDLVQCAGSRDFDIEQVTFFDLRVPADSDAHSDLFQSFFPAEDGPQRWRFRRCHFYTFDLPDIRTNQGLFLADGSYPGTEVDECLFGSNNGTSIMGPSVRDAVGAFQNCTCFSAIRGMGDGSKLVIRRNFATHLSDSKYAPGSGKNVIARPQSFYLNRPAHDHNRGYDWRDFVPVRDHGVGARDFLAELQRVWG